jgi:hypothetical protein
LEKATVEATGKTIQIEVSVDAAVDASIID